jgi:S1-C subfamily serine protease
VAERLGLQLGDIITEFNMQRIANAADLEKVLGRTGNGSRLAVIALRGNETIGLEGIL